MPEHTAAEKAAAEARKGRMMAATTANAKPGSIRNGYAAAPGSAAAKSADPAKVMTNNPIQRPA